jgi:hypothetical protein
MLLSSSVFYIVFVVSGKQILAMQWRDVAEQMILVFAAFMASSLVLAGANAISGENELLLYAARFGPYATILSTALFFSRKRELAFQPIAAVIHLDCIHLLTHGSVPAATDFLQFEIICYILLSVLPLAVRLIIGCVWLEN